MKLKKTLLAAALLLTIPLTACGAVQVNERMFVQLMGISEDSGITELTVQVFDSANAEKDGPVPVYKVLHGSGRSFYEAADMIVRENGRELFFGHCSAVFANEEVIRNGEKLKMLAGERISPGCAVLLSDSPEKAASEKDSEDELIGADRVLSVISRYKDEGLASGADLKTVTEAAEKGDFAVIPLYDGGITGCAVIDMSGGASRLGMSETAALNLMMGSGGIRLSVLDGSVTLGKVKKSIYCRNTESGGEYAVTLSLRYRLDEGGGLHKDYGEETERIISAAVGNICRRAAEDGFIGLLTGDEPDNTGELSFDISVSADAK